MAPGIASAAIDLVESHPQLTTQGLAQLAKWTIAEVACQAIDKWDTHMATAALKYLVRSGFEEAGARQVLANMSGSDPEEWRRLLECAEDEGLFDVWI